MARHPTGAAPHVFVDDLEAPELADHDRHHLERALRLRDGDALTVGDGRGGWRPAVLRPSGLEVAGEVTVVEAPTPMLTVAFAPVKGDRPEWAVQKLVELGVDRIVPLATARGVVRWEGERAARHRERLGRIAREAAMQSRRCHLPEVAEVTPVAALVGAEGTHLAVPGGPPPAAGLATVAVGPEGGWDEAEVGLAPPVGLGPHVLRTETAAVAAGALLAALRAGLVRPA